MPLHVEQVQSLNYSAPDTDATVNTTATTEIVPANSARKYLVIVNASDVIMYLAVGANAEKTKGIYLAANGGSFEMITANLSAEAVDAISASGSSKTVTVQEAT